MIRVQTKTRCVPRLTLIIIIIKYLYSAQSTICPWRFTLTKIFKEAKSSTTLYKKKDKKLKSLLKSLFKKICF